MLILGIETSCDETGAAVVKDGTNVLSNIVTSSLELHKKTGGIIPEIAAREQVKYIIPVIEESLRQAQCKSDDLDAIAVTVGPGLIGSLLVGVETAKTLSFIWHKPLIPVNHLIGHIYANFIHKFQVKQPEFPALALVVSGGHTDLVLMENHKKLKWFGGTRDDAAGEAFDKISRLLGLGYPGGPAIAAEAAKLKIKNEKLKMFPRPMINEENFDFSFSGLKTAVRREILRYKDIKKLRDKDITRLAAEVQQAIVDVLVAKTIGAAQKFKVRSILLSGGVAANQKLRKVMNSQLSTLNFQLHIPPAHLCTDNAVMIAAAAFFNYQPLLWPKIKVDPGLHF